MDRERALEELKGRLSNKNLVKHSLAVEAIMREWAVYFKSDPETWGLAGLLHDIDYDKTVNDPSMHGLVAAGILEGLEVDSAIIYAIKAHNSYHGIERKRKMDKCLFAADPTSGLITAAALILPSKKLEDVTTEFLMKRFDEKGFACGANREQILECEKLEVSLEEFLNLSLEAMKKISHDLGL